MTAGCLSPMNWEKEAAVHIDSDNSLYCAINTIKVLLI